MDDTTNEKEETKVEEVSPSADEGTSSANDSQHETDKSSSASFQYRPDLNDGIESSGSFDELARNKTSIGSDFLLPFSQNSFVSFAEFQNFKLDTLSRIKVLENSVSSLDSHIHDRLRVIDDIISLHSHRLYDIDHHSYVSQPTQQLGSLAPVATTPPAFSSASVGSEKREEDTQKTEEIPQLQEEEVDPDSIDSDSIPDDIENTSYVASSFDDDEDEDEEDDAFERDDDVNSVDSSANEESSDKTELQDEDTKSRDNESDDSSTAEDTDGVDTNAAAGDGGVSSDEKPEDNANDGDQSEDNDDKRSLDDNQSSEGDDVSSENAVDSQQSEPEESSTDSDTTSDSSHESADGPRESTDTDEKSSTDETGSENESFTSEDKSSAPQSDQSSDSSDDDDSSAPGDDASGEPDSKTQSESHDCQAGSSEVEVSHAHAPDVHSTEGLSDSQAHKSQESVDMSSQNTKSTDTQAGMNPPRHNHPVDTNVSQQAPEFDKGDDGSPKVASQSNPEGRLVWVDIDAPGDKTVIKLDLYNISKLDFDVFSSYSTLFSLIEGHTNMKVTVNRVQSTYSPPKDPKNKFSATSVPIGYRYAMNDLVRRYCGDDSPKDTKLVKDNNFIAGVLLYLFGPVDAQGNPVNGLEDMAEYWEPDEETQMVANILSFEQPLSRQTVDLIRDLNRRVSELASSQHSTQKKISEVEKELLVTQLLTTDLVGNNHGWTPFDTNTSPKDLPWDDYAALNGRIKGFAQSAIEKKERSDSRPRT